MSRAQQLLSTAAGQASNSSIDLSWSLGETLIATHASSEVVLNQGQQQSNAVLTSLRKEPGLGYQVKVMPNPGRDWVQLIRQEISSNSYIELRDSSGRLLLQEAFPGKLFQFDISSYPKGVYLIRLSDGQHSQTFQLIKG